MLIPKFSSPAAPKSFALRARFVVCFSTFSSLDSPTCPLLTFQEGVHSPYLGCAMQESDWWEGATK